ncbi:MAG TPA: L,D-transpeptidase [Candidatus Nitrosotalea sp.]|nr:L,D-transpeptidase [Candidatus Nitrosotalea sp.]
MSGRLRTRWARRGARAAIALGLVSALTLAANLGCFYLRADQVDSALARAQAQGVPAAALRNSVARLRAMSALPQALTRNAVLADPFSNVERGLRRARVSTLAQTRAAAEGEMSAIKLQFGARWDLGGLEADLAQARTPADFERVSAGLVWQQVQATRTRSALAQGSGGLAGGLPADVVTHLNALGAMLPTLQAAGLPDATALQAKADAAWYLSLSYPVMLGLHASLEAELISAQNASQQNLDAYEQSRSLLQALPGVLATTDALGLGGPYDATAHQIQSILGQPGGGPHLAQSSAQLAQLIQQMRTADSGQLSVSGVGCISGAPAKLIVVHVSTQQLVAYDNGCPWMRTLVTTGMPQLPTDQGTFHIFYKASAYKMVSPWPPSSGLWYPTTWVYDAMEFVGDGTFLHTANWEPPSVFGPGSEYGPFASHGCVHMPNSVAGQLYAWADIGTTVEVTQ